MKRVYVLWLLQEEEFLLDDAYHSEMQDTGFFDGDWD